MIHEPKIINQTSPSGGGVQHRRAITLLVNYFIKDGVFGKSKKNCRIFSLAKSLTCSKISHNLINLMWSSAIMFLFNLIKTKRQNFDSITKMLPADRVIFLGGAETVLGITDKL
ncbi:MAG: hypothetical protein OSA23_10480, partial [Rhodospirillales bacterium]|nr:hypothetical protein [Rhodospirillales bacterium]